VSGDQASGDVRSCRAAGAVLLRRRDVLLGTAAVGFFRFGGAYAQANQEKWAAVVIGVDHATDLPVLSAAVSGAKDMAKWLNNQGYDVTTITDESGPVKTEAVLGAVVKILEPPRYTRILIYFAGHGFISKNSEFWILSDAQKKDDEALNVDGSAWRARFAPIGNVVFISDACRSRSSDFASDTISGGIIFPKYPPPKVPANVDQFFATQLGYTASEAVADSAKVYHGIYTQSFLSAFNDPPVEFVRQEDGRQVVPDPELQLFLSKDVPKRAQAVSLTLRQYPDAIITSRDKVYLGCVAGSGTTGASANPPSSGGPNPADEKPLSHYNSTTTDYWLHPPADWFSGDETAAQHGLPPNPGRPLKDLATLGMRSASDQVPLELTPALRELGRESGYFATHDVVVNSAAAHDDFPARTGFVVSNAGVKQVAVTPGAKIEILRGGSRSDSALVQVETGQTRDTSVLIEFEDGSGTVVAVLPNFVGTIAVQDEGVVSVNYSPSRESGREVGDARSVSRLAQLRANAAAAAKLGVFRADNPAEAVRLANDIRVLKGIDPTLGLYAAYAYQQAGALEQIRSIADIMRGQFDLLLFDIAMFANFEPVQTVVRGGFIVPFCPMLSQGWNLLEATGARIPEPARQAARHLRQALWKTFEREGVAILLESPLFRSSAG
jgi:hypothetical protein